MIIPEEPKTPAELARLAVIERIRKLQRMTCAAGASETEALMAASMVRKLIAEHQIADTELSLRADAKHCVKDAYTAMRSDTPAWINLGIAIERLYGTIAWMEREREDVLGLGFEVQTISVYYYGFPLDVQDSVTTLAICALAIDGAIAALGRVSAARRESFELGMTDRLRERIAEMKKKGFEEVKGRGALVVLKDHLVKEEFDKTGQKLYRARGTAKAPRDAQAYARGQQAAANVALDPSVRGQAQAQRRLA